jgi:hypothetical protein
MEFLNPFEKKIEFVFACDFFVEDYSGGAELSTEILIKKSPYKVYKIRNFELNQKIIESNRDKHWIFGNIEKLNLLLIPHIIKNLNYSIIEFDYKYCRYRSPERHEHHEKTPCKCEQTKRAGLIAEFFKKSKKLWWMSKNQMEFQLKKLPILNECKSEVLSSLFDEETLELLIRLKNHDDDLIRKEALILDSNFWLKGTQNCIEWCKENNMQYTLVKDLNYIDMLKTIRSHKTLVYLPNAMDTCPRLVIEAKLIGCKLVLNDNVQHRYESWFVEDDESTIKYLIERPNYFWKITEKLGSS